MSEVLAAQARRQKSSRLHACQKLGMMAHAFIKIPALGRPRHADPCGFLVKPNW